MSCFDVTYVTCHIARAAFRAAALVVLAGLAAAWLVPLPARLGEPGSTVVLYADGSVAHVFLAPDDRWRIAVDPDLVDPAYVDALVALEDQRFWTHPGVDPLALGRAVIQNAASGTVVSGASTLTMQLVRMVEPRPRTLRSKVLEALRALQLELRMDKRAILAAYLTFAPYGRNVEGLEAASLALFGHRPDALSPGEIACLLAIPEDPNDRYPRADHALALREARDRAAIRLVDLGLLDVDREDTGLGALQALAAVLDQPVPEAMAPMPREVPHFANWIRYSRPAGSRVSTTLRPGVQGRAERILACVRDEADRHGVHGAAAVVVVEHESGELVALVGGFDFWDGEHAGQVPAFAVPRSPGSALKPFIYGLAVDEGLILPERLVEDVPVRYGSYEPGNYDGTFSGVVTAEDALSRSLNVPFVELLRALGVEAVLGRLRGAGVRSLDSRPGHYGLSAAIGGLELSPLELAGLYTAVATDGAVRVPHWDAAEARNVPLLSPGAAWLVRRALARRDRPDMPDRQQLAATPPRIRWKTGTSFGHRDAWAVGAGTRYTAAVWLGNLDNAPSPWLVGAPAAGPVLFDLLEGLGDGVAADADPPPAELQPVTLCALSGRLAGPACPHTERALALGLRVPPDGCHLHRSIEVDVETGERVGPLCRAGRVTAPRTAVVWPATVQRWLARDAATPLPALARGCEEARAVGPPRILSPADGSVALLVPGLPADAQDIRLEALSGARRLAWFVDGEFLGQHDPREPARWTPSPGRHVVVVQDDSGGQARVVLDVRS